MFRRSGIDRKWMRDVDETLLELAADISALKHQLAVLRAKSAVDIRERKKDTGYDADALLKDLLKGKVMKVFTKEELEGNLGETSRPSD